MVSLGLLGLLATSGCSSSGPSPSPSPSITPSVSPSRGGLGGTLQVAAPPGVDTLDPALADTAAEGSLLRLTTRQLMTWTTDESVGEPDAPVPDIAASDPEISSDGLAYTFKIRDGVRWDVPAGRQLTAPDVVRGFKRLCYPGALSPALPYFLGTLKGMAQFCIGLARQPRGERAAAYLEGTALPGVHADSDNTVTFHLQARSNDFLSLLTLPAASPVPTEVLRDEQTPGTLTPFASDGPYRIVEWTPGRVLRLRRNPEWTPQVDPVRTAFVDGVEIDVGVSADAAQARLRSGEADLAWGSELARGDAISLTRGKSPQARIEDRGAQVVLVFNLRHPGPLLDVRVRRALQYCADKAAIARALGAAQLGRPAAPALAAPSAQVLTPSTLGYQPRDPYATKGSAGDPGRCRRQLAAAGYAGLRLSVVPVVPDALDEAGAAGILDAGAAVLPPLTAGFAAAGVTLTPLPVRHDVVAIVAGGGTAPDWDLALVVVAPSWPGDGARSVFQPWLSAGGANDLGGYQSRAVSRGITYAVAATDEREEKARWAALDGLVMREAPWLPLARVKDVLFQPSGLGGWNYLPSLNNADPTQVFLPPRPAGT